MLLILIQEHVCVALRSRHSLLYSKKALVAWLYCCRRLLRIAVAEGVVNFDCLKSHWCGWFISVGFVPPRLTLSWLQTRGFYLHSRHAARPILMVLPESTFTTTVPGLVGCLLSQWKCRVLLFSPPPSSSSVCCCGWMMRGCLAAFWNFEPLYGELYWYSYFNSYNTIFY